MEQTLFGSTEVTRFTVGSLATNCYLIRDQDSSETLVVDPGEAGDDISEFLATQSYTVKGIALTHGHFDHVLGLLPLVLNFDCPVWLHPDDEPLYKKAASSAAYWLSYDPDPLPEITHHYFTQPLVLGNKDIQVIHSPGHTPGSVCFLVSTHKREKSHPRLLFSGDTVFFHSVGRTDFSYSNHMQLLDSLEELWKLPSDTVIFPGHGVQTTIGEEQSWHRELRAHTMVQ